VSRATHVVRLYVGLNRQTQPRNARCARQPTSYTAARVDDVFDAIRRRQGVQKPGATRFVAKGLWKGRREKTSVYEVQWFPGGSETYAQFRKNMNAVARGIAARFCQDAVLVVHRTPRQKVSLFVSPRTRRSARQVKP